MADITLDEETIVEAIRKVMQKNPRVESQRRLAELVCKELENDVDEVHLGADRIRRIAVNAHLVKIEIEYRDSSQNFAPDLCPVCRNLMVQLCNSTLTGEITEFKRKCSVCTYSTYGGRGKKPARYTFVKCSVHDLPMDEMRISKLNSAAALLRRASKLISEAVDGTSFAQRKSNSIDLINTVLLSKNMAGSIPNLIADVKTDGQGDPLWTKPIGTPKYPERKD